MEENLYDFGTLVHAFLVGIQVGIFLMVMIGLYINRKKMR